MILSRSCVKEVFSLKHSSRFVKRRHFLLGLGAFVTAASVGCSSEDSTHVVDNLQRTFEVVGDRPLNERAKSKGLIFGSFPDTGDQQFRNDEALRAAFQRECDLVVGGFYWNRTRPDPNSFDWRLPDALFDFAQEHGKLFRGHPLVWHKLYPEWMGEKLRATDTTTREVEQILEKHISTIVRHYAGKVHSWDVVNEALDPNQGRADGLRPTPWLHFMGPEYLDFTYRVAAQADPKATLVYNDFGMEYDEQTSKRRSLMQLLDVFKTKGTPVQAVGIQAHLKGDRAGESMKTLRGFLADVASMGFKILITELDVSDSKLPADINQRDKMVAAVYEDFLSIVLDEPAVTAIITWGLSDRYTWLSTEKPRQMVSRFVPCRSMKP